MELDLKQKLQKIGLSNKEADNIIQGISNELEKVRLSASLSFLSYTQKIKEPGYTFRLLGILFILESLVAAKEKKKLKKVQKFLRESLDLENKISLLENFIFSEKYEFKKGPKHPPRHIMFEDFDNDESFKKSHYIQNEKIEFCSGSKAPICYCVEWLRKNPKKIDDYLDTLIGHLYDMRHAIVHESFPVLGLPDYSEKYTAGSFSASLVDAYPVSDDKKYFRSYEVYIDPDKFFEIMKKLYLKVLTEKI